MESAISYQVPFLRRGTVDLVCCGMLSSVLLLMARQHVLAAIDMSMVLAVAAGLRKAGKQKLRGNEPKDAAGARLQDGLTGIANRDGLEGRLGHEWQRERGPGEPTAMILIRVDEFSDLQERGGPLTVDVSMLTLARALARTLPRSSDLLARYDESTFAAVLPGTDLPGALRVAARLRWTIVRLGIARPGWGERQGGEATEPAFLTASMGIGVQHGPAGKDALVEAAEGALRAASERGPDGLEYMVVEGIERSSEMGGMLLPTVHAGSRTGAAAATTMTSA